VIAYPELGPEAVRKLVVKDFPSNCYKWYIWRWFISDG